MYNFRWLWILTESSLEPIPKMFNQVHIRRLRGPIHCLEIFRSYPAFCVLGCVLWVVILLEVSSVAGTESDSLAILSIVGTRKLSKISKYCLESIRPTIRPIPPIPYHDIHPHIIRLPPPNFRVSSIASGCKFFGPLTQEYLIPSLFSLFILVSSDQITLFQSSFVQFSWHKAQFKRAL